MEDGRKTTALCVDAACSGNPGKMEYRGVLIPSGKQLFHFGPIYGTNNIGEFLAIVHGLALLKKMGSDMPVYSDSAIARSWVKHKTCNTSLKRSDASRTAHRLVVRALQWLENNDYPNTIKTWNTHEWGEIPADFGRKQPKRY